MDMLEHVPAVAEDSTQTATELAAPNTDPALAPDSNATPAPRVRCAYVLVEDIDYLIRTGRSRQVLAIRWSC
jgi:hypothetical protein